MSRYALLLIWLACAYADADDDCVCDDHSPDAENEIWNFLKEYPDGAGHEGVLAGILSPLVPCGNCIESYRKKRTILPSAANQEAVDSNVIDHESSKEEEEELPQDPRCPVGYARIGFRCIPFDDIYK